LDQQEKNRKKYLQFIFEIVLLLFSTKNKIINKNSNLKRKAIANYCLH